MQFWFLPLYVLALLGIGVYGLLGLITLWYFWRFRHDDEQSPAVGLPNSAELPFVTVQLPMFNERYVVERIVTAVTKLDYPRDRFEIQIVDDSTDDTTRVATDLIRRFRAQGFDIKLLHRSDRSGYKAGALKAAVHQAKGEYLALFDADFSPNPDFLKQTVAYFLDQPQLGVIQARWSHLNADHSTLTQAQAIAIDKHFATEQRVRHRAELFPKFNGSGGIWRRSCLLDAGGWATDTVCEDLCLSTRAMLRGWRFRYLNDVAAPAELPSTILSYKSQQARWAKGSVQCLAKYFRPILFSPQHRLTARLYALAAMGAHLANALFLLLLLLQIPMIVLDIRPSPLLLLLSVLGLMHPLLFVLGQWALYPDWLWRLRHMPSLIVLTMGLSVNQTRAIVELLFGRINHTPHEFVRTPKGTQGYRRYKLKVDWIIIFESACAIYALLGFLLAIQYGRYGSLMLLGMACIGFSSVVYLTIQEQFVATFPTIKAKSPALK